LHQIINGCYAHSAISALAFRLAAVTDNMWHKYIFAMQWWLSSQATPACLLISGNVWLRKIQRKLYPRNFFRGIQAEGSMELSVLWNTLCGLILIKEAVICNMDWCTLLVISILPDIIREEGVSEGRVQPQ